MPNITLISDFVAGETKIPNAVSQNVGESANEDLQSIIDKYEKKVMLAVLGSTQYATLQTALGDLENAAQHWKDFVEQVKEPLRNYIYCKWLSFDEVKLTTVGPGKGVASGFLSSDSIGKYVARFNDFVDGLEYLREFLDDSEQLELIDDFPQVAYCNSFFGHSAYDDL